jgi:hypothetical protein
MATRTYLTSAEAATYCGFKTIGGIQQAVRRGKLKPAGRRGGTGTYVFATADLDLFLTGGLQPDERLFVVPANSQIVDSAAVGNTTLKTRRRAPVAAAKAAPPRPQQKSLPGRSSKQVGDEDPVTRIIRALAPRSSQTGKPATPRTRPVQNG